MTAPCGKPTNANLGGVFPAAVCAQRVAAGFIASSRGSAMPTPMPLRTARREICFLVIIISILLFITSLLAPRQVEVPGAYGIVRCELQIQPATKIYSLLEPHSAPSGARRANRSMRRYDPSHMSTDPR